MIGVLESENGLDTGFTLCLSADMTAEHVRDTLRYASEFNHDRQISELERRARQILMDAGHDPDRPGDLNARAESRTIATAHLVLRHIRLWRSAMASGDCHEVSTRASEIWSLVARHDFLIDNEAAIRRGRAFLEGPKRLRGDRLARAIKEAFFDLGLDAPVKKVRSWLLEHEIIYIDTDGAIEWTSDKAREKTITLKSLENRVANIRGRLKKGSSK
jgi:hypothetical protein